MSDGVIFADGLSLLLTTTAGRNMLATWIYGLIVLIIWSNVENSNLKIFSVGVASAFLILLLYYNNRKGKSNDVYNDSRTQYN